MEQHVYLVLLAKTRQQCVLNNILPSEQLHLHHACMLPCNVLLHGSKGNTALSLLVWFDHMQGSRRPFRSQTEWSCTSTATGSYSYREAVLSAQSCTV